MAVSRNKGGQGRKGKKPASKKAKAAAAKPAGQAPGRKAVVALVKRAPVRNSAKEDIADEKGEETLSEAGSGGSDYEPEEEEEDDDGEDSSVEDGESGESGGGESSDDEADGKGGSDNEEAKVRRVTKVGKLVKQICLKRAMDRAAGVGAVDLAKITSLHSQVPIGKQQSCCACDARTTKHCPGCEVSVVEKVTLFVTEFDLKFAKCVPSCP
jgi:hypothetical protein